MITIRLCLSDSWYKGNCHKAKWSAKLVTHQSQLLEETLGQSDYLEAVTQGSGRQENDIEEQNSSSVACSWKLTNVIWTSGRSCGNGRFSLAFRQCKQIIPQSCRQCCRQWRGRLTTHMQHNEPPSLVSGHQIYQWGMSLTDVRF